MATPTISPAIASYNPGTIIKFDWENKWLKGEEYAHILKNSENYTKTYNFKCFPSKTHPKSIYLSPISIFLIRWSYIFCGWPVCRIRIWISKAPFEKAI